MAPSLPGILTFKERYFERVWGGRNLESLYGKPLPSGKVIGEAWLISDHPQHESVVDQGSMEGRTLTELLKEFGASLLGSVPRPTIQGLFPLLLKLLDAQDYLSIQVHPDDADAARLGENDGGKTEMWHILRAEDGSEVLCGLKDGIDGVAMRKALDEGYVEDTLKRIPVTQGDSIFVPAKTVHAIGPGIVLAEIQQNSDVTYRVHDWGGGRSRELHVDKSLDVMNFGAKASMTKVGLALGTESPGGRLLAASPFFAAESWKCHGIQTKITHNRSFHMILATEGSLFIKGNEASVELEAGAVAFIPGATSQFTVEGRGSYLEYYVPDLVADIRKPLNIAGYDDSEIDEILSI